MKRLVVLIAISAVIAGGRACADLEWVMVPSAARGTLEVALYAHNPGPGPAALNPPAVLGYRLMAMDGSGDWTGVLTAAEPGPAATTLAAGTYRKAVYRGPIAMGATGLSLLSVSLDSVLPALVVLPTDATAAGHQPAVACAPPPAVPPAAATERLTSAVPAAVRTRLHGAAAYLAHFSPYEPVYIVAGTGEVFDAKFQISFRYQLFGDQMPWLLSHLFLGYTQTTVWDLAEESAPFHDTSYKPGLFLYEAGAEREGFLSRIGWETGMRHESNGKGGADSRSVNTIYFTPILTLGHRTPYSLTLAPRVYAYVEKSDNSDIDDYRGYCDLVLTLERHESWMLSTTLRKGMSAYKGSVQVDFAYPMDRLFNAAPHLYLHVQYFAGYGETILDYDDKASSQLRLGIMLAY